MTEFSFLGELTFKLLIYEDQNHFCLSNILFSTIIQKPMEQSYPKGIRVILSTIYCYRTIDVQSQSKFFYTLSN